MPGRVGRAAQLGVPGCPERRMGQDFFERQHRGILFWVLGARKEVSKPGPFQLLQLGARGLGQRPSR